MTRVLAVANQKGGVAKTTTSAALGAAFAALGRSVLLVDLDAQACLTFALGAQVTDLSLGAYEVLKGASLDGATVRTAEGMDLLPATIDLAALDSGAEGLPSGDLALRGALEPVLARYDDVVLDCSPSLAVTTVNALVAADDVLVPLAAEMLAHRAVGQLLDTVEDVRAARNPGLRVVGLLPTMVDLRTSHAREVIADLHERYGVPVLPAVPRSVRVAEAPTRGLSVLSTAPRSRAAVAYRRVARILLGEPDPGA